jgi:hypothetical protein
VKDGGSNRAVELVVLMRFVATLNDPALTEAYLLNHSGFSRIRPRILHSVVGSLSAKRKDEPTDTGA